MPDDTRLLPIAPDLLAERLAQLKTLLPEAFSEGRLEITRLQQALGEAVDTGRERYGLSWAGKSEAIRTLLSPGQGTLRPCPAESVNFEASENLIIEGDNLEVLKLLQRSYHGKVKLIYIDPPYNTGNDFIYKDDFRDSLGAYQRFTGDQDAEGKATTSNRDTSGRFHSNWLNMMHPRLHLARNLLRDDGVIFVSIDDNEVHNLRLLMNEVFWEENFIADIVWNSTKSVTNTALISVSHTHNLVFAKTKEFFVENRNLFRLPESGEGFENPDKDPRGPWKADPFQVGGERPNQLYTVVNPNTGEEYRPLPGNSWKNEYSVFKSLLADNRVVFGSSGEAGPQRKRFLSEALSRGRVAKTLWDDIDTTTNATRKLKDLFGESIFDNPKPIDLIQRFIGLGEKGADEPIIIVDFFAGSGTTAHAVMDLNEADGGNRKFILVQLPEPTDRPEYPTIAHITRERVRRVIARMEAARAEPKAADLLAKNKTLPTLGFRALRLDASNFRRWQADAVTADNLPEQLALHADHRLPDRSEQDCLFELMLRAGLPLSARIEQRTVGNSHAWCITQGGRTYLFCLAESLDQAVLDALRAQQPDTLVCLDAAFDGNDALKTNTVLQMKDAGIRFHTA